MAQKVILKHGTNVGFDTIDLVNGEPVFNLETERFYIGKNGEKIWLNQVTKQEFDDLESDIYNEIGTIDNEISVMQTEISTNKNDIQTLFGDIVVIDGKVTTLQNDVITINGNIQMLFDDVLDINGDIVTINGQISTIQGTLNNLGTSAFANIGTNIGNVVSVQVGGKIDPTVIPVTAITETFVVSSEAQMLALQANTGDVAIRTDISETFILQGSNPSLLSNWVMLLTPPDKVLTVNNLTGSVTLTGDNTKLGTGIFQSPWGLISGSETLQNTLAIIYGYVAQNRNKLDTFGDIVTKNVGTNNNQIPSLTKLIPTANITNYTFPVGTTPFISSAGGLYNYYKYNVASMPIYNVVQIDNSYYQRVKLGNLSNTNQKIIGVTLQAGVSNDVTVVTGGVCQLSFIASPTVSIDTGRIAVLSSQDGLADCVMPGDIKDTLFKRIGVIIHPTTVPPTILIDTAGGVDVDVVGTYSTPSGSTVGILSTDTIPSAILKLDTAITALATRITALETTIDGGTF